MRHLPKHLQPRWRYLAVGIETWPDAAFDRGSFQRALWDAAQNLFGDAGSAAADLSVYGFTLDGGTGGAVVRARRQTVDRARAAVACIDAVDGHEVGLRIRGVSGTVRACEERYLPRGNASTTHQTVAFAGARRDAFVRDGAVDVRVGDEFVGATTRE